jgi:hypothetical protein
MVEKLEERISRQFSSLTILFMREWREAVLQPPSEARAVS